MLSWVRNHRLWWAIIPTALFLFPIHAKGETFEVTLEGLSFWYAGMANMEIDLAIDPGDTIRWSWVEGFHNVVSGFPEDPDTGELFFSGEPTGEAGTIFEFTFIEPGVYGYHCHPHEGVGMVSSITVVPEPSTLALLGVVACACLRRRVSH